MAIIPDAFESKSIQYICLFVFAEALFFAVLVLADVLGYFLLFILPLGFARTVRLAFFPLAFVNEIEIADLGKAFYLSFYERSFVVSTIVVSKSSFSMPETLVEISFVKGSIFEDFFSFSALQTSLPMAFISPYRITTHIEPFSIRQPTFPLPFIKISISKEKLPSALKQALSPFPLIVHSIFEHHKAKLMSLILENLPYIDTLFVAFNIIADGRIDLARVGTQLMDGRMVIHEIYVTAFELFINYSFVFSRSQRGSQPLRRVSQQSLLPIFDLQFIRTLMIFEILSNWNKTQFLMKQRDKFPIERHFNPSQSLSSKQLKIRVGYNLNNYRFKLWKG